ncbi:hypothetical protein V8E54_002369 [Elaphomyces granulatus]|jgi:hypothetical protein
MNFFNLPAEIRLQVYKELLVFPEPIKFKTTKDLSLPPLVLHKRCNLCPAVLRANKRVHREANGLLYTGNRFEFIDLVPTERLMYTDCTAVEAFLNQIGRQNSSLLRHICIDFPAISDYRPGSACLHGDSIRTLTLLRENCTSLTTLETPLYDIIPLEVYHEDTGKRMVADAAVDLVDARFRDISSLKQIVVNVYTYDEYKNLDYDLLKNPSDDLLRKMRDHGWTTKITTVEDMEEEEEEAENDSDIDSDEFLGIEMEDEEEEEEEDSDY